MTTARRTMFLAALTLARRTQSLAAEPLVQTVGFLCPPSQLHDLQGRHHGYRLFATVDRPETNSDTDSSSSNALNGPSAIRSTRPTPTSLPYLQMVSFYRFSPLSNPAAARDGLFDELVKIDGLRGTAYLATEGTNAQFAIPTSTADPCSAGGGNADRNVERLLDAFRIALPFDPFEINAPNYGDVVDSSAPTFERLVVRTRDAILRDGLENDDGIACREGGGTVTAGRVDFDWSDAGVELSPNEWDKELRRAGSSSASSSGAASGGGDGLLLDCRNSYESEVGSFAGAIPLGTKTFSETWPVLRETTKGLDRTTPLRIFCTGGIRCVKVGAYLKQELGFEDVRRLEHGIVGYQRWVGEKIGSRVEATEEEKGLSSLWEGENFLFDKRRLEKGKVSSGKS